MMAGMGISSGMVALLGGVAAGLPGGVLSGLFGVGGGFVLLPLLRLVLGFDQHEAQGVTLAALTLPCALPAVFHYRSRGIALPWGLLKWLVLGFLPGVWGGAALAGEIPEGPLRWLFVGFLVVMAVGTAFPASRLEEGDRSASEAPAWKGLLVGFAGGAFSGMLGTGGSVVVVPLLVVWMRVRQHQAQLLSLALAVAPVRFPGLWVYIHGSGGFPWMVFCGLAAGFPVGTYLGAHLSTAVPGVRLRGAYAGVMLLMAMVLVWQG